MTIQPRLIWTILFPLAVGFFSEPAQAELTRAEFAKAMNALTPGMPAEQVVALLGKPDDIRTRYDAGGIVTTRTTEIRGYGTDGHLGFPTLGRVFMEKGKVQYICGGTGSPPDPAMFDEADLKSILRQIDKTSATDPLSLIQIVNRLQALGKDRSLAAISEYVRVTNRISRGPTELFLILRLLFEIPKDPGFMPRMGLGAPYPPEPADPKLLPLFPLVLLNDIPLYVIRGYLLAGLPQRVEDHIEYFRKSGMLRQHPLRPTDNPLGVLASYEQSPQWICFGPQLDKGDLANQLLRLVRSVYRIEPDKYGGWFDDCQFDQKRWDKIVSDVAALHVKWDPVQNIYVFANGTSLPEIRKPVYRRNIWDLSTLGPEANLAIERLDRKYVNIMLWHGDWAGHHLAACVVRLHRTDGERKRIAQFKVPPSFGDGIGHQDACDTELPAGGSVQAELIYKGKTETSPIFVP